MHLFVQIPCLNEAETLPATLADLPKSIEGVDKISVLVINDGSTDNTAEVARAGGVDHILSFSTNKGLARGFQAGLDECLRLGADIIVNTDADNQYSGADIERIVRPILNGDAEIVIGDRQVATIEHFSLIKIALQKLGSWVVRQLSGTQVADATSGMRAMSREAALNINVITDFTYTLEMIIQAGKKRIPVICVPIKTNPATRPSRLFSSIRSYVTRSSATILRMYTMYEPLKAFFYLALPPGLIGLLLGGRFIYFYATGSGAGHVQSLILTAVLLLVSVQLMALGVLADLIADNRKLLERQLYHSRKTLFAKQDGETDK